MAQLRNTTVPYKDLRLEGADFTNPRQNVSARGISELADSIEQHSLITPLTVWRTKVNGKDVNVILDGGRRYRAITKLVKEKRANGLSKKVPVRLIAARSLAEARIKALTANLQREDLSSFEIATTIAALKAEGMKQQDIATQINKSATWVSRMLSAFRDASPAVKRAWKGGKLPDDDVQHLAKLEDHDDQDKRLSKLLEHREDSSSRADRAKARSIAKNGDGKKKPKPRAVRLGADKLEAFLKQIGNPPKTAPYVRGMRDMLEMVLGQRGPGELDKEWQTYAAKKGFGKSDAKKKPAKKAGKKKSK